VPTPLVVRALAGAAGVALIALPGASCVRYPVPASGQAQSQPQIQGAGVARGQSRRDLEARAAGLSRDPRRAAEVAQIRARLRDGDFQVGDMIVLSVLNVPQFSDTFPVRAGRVLQIPEISPIPLSGVLRSELQSHLRRHIARYVINPSVEAYSLVRVAVAGAVARPGFYEVRPDAPVSEAVMSAGGFGAQADATKMSVRRAGRVVIPAADLRTAVAMGATLDDVSIRPGDEIRVEERARRNWADLARTLAYFVAAAGTLVAAATR